MTIHHIVCNLNTPQLVLLVVPVKSHDEILPQSQAESLILYHR